VNASIRTKLERLDERFGEVTALLAEPEIQASQDRFRELSREYAQIEPVVQCFTRYREIEDEIATSEELLRDPEMAELARDEVTAACARRDALEPELQRLLLPPDPNDQRNVFLEVRAGTGGAEAALFAADVQRMYARYAETRGWQTELIGESEGELGGYKEVVMRISGKGVYSRLKF
jgi:peptide chain release factor 1